jgi:hypothetical protein
LKVLFAVTIAIDNAVNAAIVANADARRHGIRAHFGATRYCIGHMCDESAALGSHFAALQAEAAINAVWPIPVRGGQNGNRSTRHSANA